MRIALCLTLCLLAVQGGHCLDFDCAFVPQGLDLSDANTSHSFKLHINASEFETGSSTPVQVTLFSMASNPDRPQEKPLFNHFIIQAHGIMDKPCGRWQVLDKNLQDYQTKRCEADADTLVNKPGRQALIEVVALWYPPQQYSSEVDYVDFNAAVMNGDGYSHFWTGIQSIMLKAKKPQDPHSDPSENEEQPYDPSLEEEEAPPTEEVDQGTGEDPNEGEERAEEERERAMELDHGLIEETEQSLRMEEERQEKIRQEDLESEQPWVREEEEARLAEEKAQDDEMREYEKFMADEEARRLSILEFEIHDKEENPAPELPTEKPDIHKPDGKDGQNEVKPDRPAVKDNLVGGNGVGRAVLSGLLLVCSLLAVFL